MNKTKHKVWGYIFLGVFLITIAILTHYIPGLEKFSSPEYVRNILISFGNWGYLFFILILITAILSPLPVTAIVLAGGYVYGLLLGSLLSVLAMIGGASILFILIKKLGRPLLELFVDKHHLIHFQHLLKKKGIVGALISYIVPFFPSSSVMLIVGFTGVNYGTFITLVILGHIPRFMIINSLGADLHTGFTIKTIYIALLGLTMVLIAMFRVPLRKFIFKELQGLELETKKIEEKIRIERKRKSLKEKKEKKKKKNAN